MTINDFNRTPEQCRLCRHSHCLGDRAVCRARPVRHCEHGGGVQQLCMAPGLCRLLNPDNDCDLYSSQRRYNLLLMLVMILFGMLLGLSIAFLCPEMAWKGPAMM